MSSKLFTKPTCIRVLGKKIAVEFVPANHEGLKDSPEDQEPGNGRNDPDNQKIWVALDQPLESEQDTLLHEVFHILEAFMEIRISETAVRKLATGLLAVIKDNPSFITYLKK